MSGGVVRSLGVLHPTFEDWGGAEWYLHQSTTWLARERGIEAAVYTHRWTEPPGDERPYRVTCHRRGGYASAPWDWRRIGREIAADLAAHDVLLLHNYPATMWYAAAATTRSIPPALWYCHEPPRSLHPDATEVSPEPDVLRAGEGIGDALRFYGARAVWRVGSRAAASLASRLGGESWRARLKRVECSAVTESMTEIVANSAYTAQRVEHLYGKPAQVIHPLPPDLLHATPVAAADKQPLVLCVGRMTSAKRPELLLDAWERTVAAEERLKDYRLLFVGDGPLRPRIESRAARTGLSVAVEHGLPRNELMLRYGRALVTVHLGVDEPFGLVPLESMAAGTAVLAHAGGGVTETMVDGETGWCSGPLDLDTLVERLRRLPDEREHLVAMGRRAAEHVRARFDPDRALSELSDKLASVASARQA